MCRTLLRGRLSAVTVRGGLMRIKKFLPWLPGVICEAAAIAFCIGYAASGGREFTMFLQLIAAALLPFLVPVYSLISKKPLTPALSVAAAVFVFLASDLGSGLGFYDIFGWWDMFMHGAFGFLCSLAVFVLIVRWGGERLNPVGVMVIIFMFTLGVAALWEIWEYAADSITGGDSQRVEESIALGKSPVADTMEDIIIAIAGIAAFYIALLADKLSGYRVCSKMCGFSGFKSGKAAQDGGDC